MAKKKSVAKISLLEIVAWITGVIVSLAVGFSMTGSGALNSSIPWLSGVGNGVIVAIAGWIVVVTTILSIILAIFKK